jgi:Protein of unknown function (DUF2865)
MSLLPARATRLSLAIAIAAYVTGTVLAGLAVAQAVQRIGIAVLGQLEPVAATAAPPTIQRTAAMTPLGDRSLGVARPGAVHLAAGPRFGSSSRNAGPFEGYGRRAWGDDDDDDDAGPSGRGGAYRTLCVRLCDGYYFPISFSASPGRFERDAQVCASQCGTQARLFVHPNPGGAIEDMKDLAGRPYSQLRTAFLYRTEYVPSCKCQPHPWESAALNRHRAYALAAAARGGNRDAAKELRALQAKVKQAASAPDPAPITPPVPQEVTRANAAAVAARQAEIAAREAGGIMQLGGNGAPKASPEPRPERAPPPAWRGRDPDWVRRAFEPGQGG